MGLGDLAVPTVAFEKEPDPASDELHLVVTEHDCNSGEDAAGRVEVVRLEETSDRVELVLAVRTRMGSASCPSNPETPVTVALSAPLGDRTVVDAGFAIPREIEMSRRL